MSYRPGGEAAENLLTYEFENTGPPQYDVVARPRSTPRLRVQTIFREPSKTQQNQAAACDINNIMAKYSRTGAIDHATKYQGWYGVVPALDYREALEQVDLAKRMFSELPAELRRNFKDDPGEFLSFVQSDPPRADLEELGLVPRVEPEIVPAKPSDAPA